MVTFTSVLFHVNGSEARWGYRGKKPSLAELQAAVGGYVEAINLPAGFVMLVDEDGLMKQLPVNQRASQEAGRVIVGNALVLDRRLMS